ncbi:MAG: DsbA family protein [Rhodobacteraceae bacterium]|nr:DsbA family protein [Paracoccaceae bacterium]
MPDTNDPVVIDYFSDMLCIWAFIHHRRIEELARKFGAGIEIRSRYCSVFSDTGEKIGTGWGDRGGYEGYANHVAKVASGFPHIGVNPVAWRDTRPASSAPVHQVLKALDILEADEAGEAAAKIPYLDRLGTRAAWALRVAFFAEGRDIADPSVQGDIMQELGVEPARVFDPALLARAAAALAQDFDLSRKLGVEGSPSMILNSGRQRLFGNVGYRVMEANVEELIHRPSAEEVSWC